MTANRIVLVDETGRVYDRTGVSVEVHTQDDGLTLKVFVSPLSSEEAEQAQAALDHNFAADIKAYRIKMTQGGAQ